MKGKGSSHSKGQGLTEYALILVLVAIVVIIVLAIFGPAVGNAYSSVMNPFGEDSEGETGNETPGECYSSLLISLMVGTMGAVTLIRHFLFRRTVEPFASI